MGLAEGKELPTLLLKVQVGGKIFVELVYTFIHVLHFEDVSVHMTGIQFVAMMEEHIPMHVKQAVIGWV